MKKKFGLMFLMLFTIYVVKAQEILVTGQVTSQSDGLPIPGVSVLQKGSSHGTVTDAEGKYSISTDQDATLQFSYVGMENHEAVVVSSVLNVALQETFSDLEDVIVVGYGTQKKSVVTGAISSVSAEDLQGSRPSRIEDVLKGKVSGVQITQSSGQPGTDSKVRIRGIGTVNNSEPLYIVDGMAVDGGINYLNPSDIQSVEILKDAASAAVYGARAANGVVLVTTKTGSVGKPTINYDFTYGLQNPWKKREILNAQEYMLIMNESALNDGNSPIYSDTEIADFEGKGTDWQDETFNYDAPVANHQVSIQGGNEKGDYFLSLGHYNQEGIVGGNFGKSNYKRYSVRVNNSYTAFETDDRDFLDKVRIGANIGYSRGVSSGIETNSEYGSILGSALSFSPLVPVYAEDPDAVYSIIEGGGFAPPVLNKDGVPFSLPPSGFQEIANPVAMLHAPQKGLDNDDKFVSTFWGELDILPNLRFRSSYGADLAFWGADGHTFEHFLASQGKNFTQSSVYSNMHRGFRWQVENTLTYNTTLNELHNLTVLAGQSAMEYKLRELYGDDYDLLENDPRKANINSAIADRSLERVAGGTGGFSSATLASYFGRVDYNYAEKYMLQATVRRDGSSNFGPNNKWAVFPSISAGWNITNESFLERRPDFIDHLRIRGSWGVNGNERIGPFRYTSLMQGGQNYYFGAGDDMTMYYGASPSALSNPSVKWEETQQTNVGFEGRFLSNKLSFGLDYYIKKTKGMLMDQPIPDYVGKGKPIGNAGEMENSGWEFELGFREHIGDFALSINANASYMKNKLINLGNESGENVYENAGASGVGPYVKGENGEVFPYFYGFKTDGLIQNQAEAQEYNSTYGKNAQPGDVRFVDFNNDGKIDDSDRTKIGKGMPDWTFGLNVNADWKNFDLNLFFQGTQGNDIFDFASRGDIPQSNRPAWILNRWVGEGTSNTIPRMTRANPNGNWASSDLYIKDGSYIRLKNIQLGYTLPESINEKISIAKLRIFISGENMLTFTKYDGFDPEIASGGYTTIGIDRGIYPQARTVSFGTNIIF